MWAFTTTPRRPYHTGYTPHRHRPGLPHTTLTPARSTTHHTTLMPARSTTHHTTSAPARSTTHHTPRHVDHMPHTPSTPAMLTPPRQPPPHQPRQFNHATSMSAMYPTTTGHKKRRTRRRWDEEVGRSEGGGRTSWTTRATSTDATSPSSCVHANNDATHGDGHGDACHVDPQPCPR